MLVGNPKEWTNRFKSIDVRFLERVAELWTEFSSAIPSNPLEDEITRTLVVTLMKDPKASRLFHYLEYQFEPIDFTASGRAFSKGKIDMALFPEKDRERYLAYECKRLNVVRNGTVNSLAGPYVAEGIIRFVRQQYAADLPVGCMLGYVMDGKAKSAREKIRNSIASQRANIGLLYDPIDDQPIGLIERLISRHERASSGTIIEIRHALLPL